MSRAAPFFAGSLRASLPLWVWAAHFAACYVGVAIGCHAGWHEGTVAGLSPLQWGLGAATALALAVAAALAWRACRPGAPAAGLQPTVRRLLAWLALLGIAWAAVPVLVLPSCHVT
jgi:hypothetical protein